MIIVILCTCRVSLFICTVGTYLRVLVNIIVHIVHCCIVNCVFWHALQWYFTVLEYEEKINLEQMFLSIRKLKKKEIKTILLHHWFSNYPPATQGHVHNIAISVPVYSDMFVWRPN